MNVVFGLKMIALMFLFIRAICRYFSTNFARSERSTTLKIMLRVFVQYDLIFGDFYNVSPF